METDLASALLAIKPLRLRLPLPIGRPARPVFKGEACMLIGVCARVQGLSSVTAAMTDGPFEIGDRVVSLSSSSQGPPLGLKGLVRCPGTLRDKAACSDVVCLQGASPTSACVCVMAEPSIGTFVSTNEFDIAYAGGGHL